MGYKRENCQSLFSVRNRVKQGFVLAQYYSFSAWSLCQMYNPGNSITNRTDIWIFNINTKVTIAIVRDQQYADDCAKYANNLKENLQKQMNPLIWTTNKFGLTKSIQKTKVLYELAKISTVSWAWRIVDGIVSNAYSFKRLGSSIV